MNVPFNRAHLTGLEAEAIARALASGHLSGNGPFTKACQAHLESRLGCPKVLLTHSGTAALEMAALLANLQPGDEVIMPSYTFVSTANAFVLRGAVPVFVDVRPDTFNLDETKIEAAITPRTRVIVPVHYAGVGCAMDAIMALAHQHGLLVIEDAAQAYLSNYKGRPLGTLGHLGALSFHETKNIVAGEGGALLINDPQFASRAEILWEKGTNRTQFYRGEVDKYTWVDVGSSFLPGELIAAFLWAQLQDAESITANRRASWDAYHQRLCPLEQSGWARRPSIPADCVPNGHLYYLLLPDLATRSALIANLKDRGIGAVFHYVPLHDSPAGRKHARPHGDLPVTVAAGQRILRLPLWAGLDETAIDEVATAVATFAGKRLRSDAGHGGPFQVPPHRPSPALIPGAQR